MQNGELEGYKAKLIVLMLGTNNINRNPNDEIVDGDRLIIEEFKKRQPQAKVLMLGIFPRAASATRSVPRLDQGDQQQAREAGGQQAGVLHGHRRQVPTPDGTLTTEIMPDGLHPNLGDIKIWADAISARVKELMK